MNFTAAPRRVRRVALAAVAVVAMASVAIPDGHRAFAAPAEANLVAGFTDPAPATNSRLTVNAWGFKRFGIYGVTIGGQPARAVSIAVDPNNRHRRPAADQLKQLPNMINSPLLDDVLWKYSGTSDPVQAMALHLVAWQIAKAQVGSPVLAVSGPLTPGWGPPLTKQPGVVFQVAPVDVTGNPNAADPVTLGDMVEQAARQMVSGVADDLGPWTLDVALDWGSFIGTVKVRSGNNSPLAGLTVQLSSGDAVVPSEVTTDENGTASFIFSPNGAQATVTASVTSPGVHKEYDADVPNEPVIGGYQRIAVGQSQVVQDSFTARQPVIATFAKDAVDGDKSVGAGGQIIDTVQYQNLIPGDTYTAQVIWQYQDTNIATALTATRSFPADPSGTGQIDVGPLAVTPSETGRTLVAFVYLYRGPDTSGFPEAVHADLYDPAETLSVQTPQMVSVAHDLFDDDHTTFAAGRVYDTVSYLGLAPGSKYTAKVEWHVTDGTNDLGATTLTATQTFFADPSGSGNVNVGPVQVTPAEIGEKIVALERIYPGASATGVPVAEHLDPSDSQQQIDVVPPLLVTVARDADDGDKNVIALGRVNDTVAYSSLEPGNTYTLQLEWHVTDGLNDLGATGLTSTKTFTATDSAGLVTVGPTSLNQAVSGSRLVAFERLYLGPTATGTPLAVHESPQEIAQQVDVGPLTISTDATDGTPAGAALPGDKQITIGSGSTIVDTVTLTAVPEGTTVKVDASLVRYDSGECSDAVSSTSFTTTVGPGGVLTAVHPVPEAPGEYVTYVVVRSVDGVELAEHQDCTAESQRVDVSGGDLPATL